MNFVIFIIPIAMLFISFHYKKLAKGKISDYSGFRNGLSKSSKRNWTFANKYAGKLCLIFGLILLAVSVIISIELKVNQKKGLTIVIIQLIIYSLITFVTEEKLKKLEEKSPSIRY